MTQPSAGQMTVTIFNKEYRVSCPENQEEHLAEAADFLNRRMQETKKASAHLATEQAVAMTALNLAHEWLDQDRRRRRQQQNNDTMRDRLCKMKERLDRIRIQSRAEAGTKPIQLQRQF